MPEKRYYVVAYTRRNFSPADPEDAIWTVSTDPLRPGWETDSATDGYGLHKAEAQFLCDAANEKLARGC